MSSDTNFIVATNLLTIQQGTNSLLYSSSSDVYKEEKSIKSENNTSKTEDCWNKYNPSSNTYNDEKCQASMNASIAMLCAEYDIDSPDESK